MPGHRALELKCPISDGNMIVCKASLPGRRLSRWHLRLGLVWITRCRRWAGRLPASSKNRHQTAFWAGAAAFPRAVSHGCSGFDRCRCVDPSGGVPYVLVGAGAALVGGANFESRPIRTSIFLSNRPIRASILSSKRCVGPNRWGRHRWWGGGGSTQTKHGKASQQCRKTAVAPTEALDASFQF